MLYFWICVRYSRSWVWIKEQPCLHWHIDFSSQKHIFALFLLYYMVIISITLFIIIINSYYFMGYFFSLSEKTHLLVDPVILFLQTYTWIAITPNSQNDSRSEWFSPSIHYPLPVLGFPLGSFLGLLPLSFLSSHQGFHPWLSLELLPENRVSLNLYLLLRLIFLALNWHIELPRTVFQWLSMKLNL